MAYRTFRRVRGTNGQVITVHIVDALADLPSAATQAPGNEAHGILGSDDGKVWRAVKTSSGMAWVQLVTGATLSEGLTVGGPASMSVATSEANSFYRVLTLTHTTSDAGHGQAGIGAGINCKVENAAGDSVSAGTIGASVADATAGSERGYCEMLPAFSGTPAAAGFRVAADVASAQNGLYLSLSAGTNPVYLSASGSGANIALRVRGKGSGAFEVREPDDSSTLIAAGATGLGFFGASEVAQQAQQAALTLTTTGNFAVPAEPTAAEIVTRMNLAENRLNAISTALRNLGLIAT